jgi:hypothetical protein
MPFTSDGFQPRATEKAKIKQLFWTSEEPQKPGMAYQPFFCVEARIDFNDVRTGFRDTVSLCKAVVIYSTDAEFLWTDDMMKEIDLRNTNAAAPEGSRLEALPDYVDANFISRMELQFSQYLMRSFDVRIYRNFDLNAYSFSGETSAEFSKRCMELCDAEKCRELDLLHDVFLRRLDQIKQKFADSGNSPNLDQAGMETRNKDRFFKCLDRIAELFFQAEINSNKTRDIPVLSKDAPELEERLLSLELECRQAIARICGEYEEKARSVEEYILHPNLKDIHFVRTCIIWMPESAV